MILDQRVMAEAYCSTANLGAGFNVFGLALSKYAEASPLLEISYHQIREQLEPLWNRKVVPIVSGFVASTVDGSITTLGRGESDYTAALLGAALATEEIWIWTDVDGLMFVWWRKGPQNTTYPSLSLIVTAQRPSEQFTKNSI